MKRLALSVVGGVVIPFLYTIIVGPLSTYYTQNYRLSFLMSFPIRWPIIILQRLLPLDSFPFRDEDAALLLLFIILCDVLLYSFLTYILLRVFWKQKPRQFAPPPEPPSFVQ